MNVNREKLVHILEMLLPGISTKEIIEQGNCVVFSGGRAYTYNDEVACSITSPFGSEIEGGVNHPALLGVLQKMKEDDLDVSLEKETLNIRGKNKLVQLNLQKVISLPIHMIERPKKEDWKILEDDFLEAIGIISRCVSQDEQQFTLTCVNIHPKWIEATDVYQMCRWKINNPIEEPFVVRGQSIRHVVSLGVIKMAETSTWIHFRNLDGLTMSCRKYVEEFPDCSSVLKLIGEDIDFPKGLTEAAEKAHIFSSENLTDDLIHLSVSPNKVVVEGYGLSGKYRETKKINYVGNPLQFKVSSTLLTELLKKHTSCIVSNDKLMVKGRKYKYVICLIVPNKENKNE